jgi:hypothetical protein
MGQAESVELRWDSIDTTTVAEHITSTGVIQMAYQQEPDSINWSLRSDGKLVGFTIDRSQDVRGWHPHSVGGVSDTTTGKHAVVECIEILPTRNGPEELWAIVRREIDGNITRYIEYIGDHHSEGDDPDDAFYVDCGLSLHSTVGRSLTPGVGADVSGSKSVSFIAGGATFSPGDDRYIMYKYITYDDFGDPVLGKSVAKIVEYVDTTEALCDILVPWPNLNTIPAGEWYASVDSVSGLDHLEGQTVSVVVDGATQPKVVVASGAIQLQTYGFIIHVGLGYKSLVVPMPIEGGSANGSSQGKTRRVSRASIRLSDTMGIKYGRIGGAMDLMLARDAGAIMDSAPKLFTGDLVVPWPDGYSRDGLMCILQEDPTPFTLIGLFPQLTVQDSI